MNTLPRKDSEPIQTHLSTQLRQKARRELVLAILIVTAFTVFTLLLELEFVEWFYELTRAHEDWDMDEALLFLLWAGLVGLVYSYRRVQDIKCLNKEVSNLAFNDLLTGLPNRALSLDRLKLMLEHARRYRTQVAIVFLDLDDFKIVNDTHGHDKGDILITQVGERLRKSVRSNDTVGRLSGDEFLLLLEFKGESELEEINQRLSNIQQTPFLLGLTQVNISFSLGIALFPRNGTTPTELLKAADTAMYKTKKLGKGSVNYYTEDMGKQLSERYAIESGLKKVIEKQELYLEYQPQIHLSNGIVSGYEALLRW